MPGVTVAAVLETSLPHRKGVQSIMLYVLLRLDHNCALARGLSASRPNTGASQGGEAMCNRGYGGGKLQTKTTVLTSPPRVAIL